MTAAALTTIGRLRPPYTTVQGATVAKGFKVVSYYAGDDDRTGLEALARLRFGNNRTAAIRWAVELAALVASDPATYGQLDPAAALDAYVKVRCGEG